MNKFIVYSQRPLSLLILITLTLDFLALSFIPIIYAIPEIAPTINDPNLKVERVVGGLKFPTSMAFLGPNDILVLEKNNGTVRRIVNGVMLPEPVLDVNVATYNERGMLGIAVAKNITNSTNTRTYVFLYYTESSGGKDGDDDCPKPSYCEEWNGPIGNRLYRYELIGNKLVHPKLLLDLPASIGSAHNGGAIALGPDNNIYVPIGEVSFPKTLASNIQNGLPVDGRGGILRITQDGKPVGNGILGNNYPLNLYYGYGIRNSFGLAFDPVSKKLWDTENGPGFGDEINLVEPGFNGGWNKVQGIWAVLRDGSKGNITIHPSSLVDFKKEGKYSPPEFTSVYPPVGPTALKFLDSDKLGKEYENNLFVADFHHGSIYHFDLNKKRTGLSLKGPLLDKIANDNKELRGVTFGTGFGGITDIQVGPDDGYLYVLSLYQGGDNCTMNVPAGRGCIHYSFPIHGAIFRIIPARRDEALGVK
jgi:aldose sugar dehydrogenase